MKEILLIKSEEEFEELMQLDSSTFLPVNKAKDIGMLWEEFVECEGWPYRTEGDKTEGDKTEGDKTEGDKTEGDKTEGDKTEDKQIAEPFFQVEGGEETLYKYAPYQYWHKWLIRDIQDKLKKDVLSQVVLTCRYWNAERLGVKKIDEYFEKDIDRDRWPVELELEVDCKKEIKTKDFAVDFKKAMITPPSFSAKGRSINPHTRYGIDNIWTEAYVALSEEEKYLYQYITGFPVAMTVFDKVSEICVEDKEEKAKEMISKICSIKEIHVRQAFLRAFFEDVEDEEEKAKEMISNICSIRGVHVRQAFLGAFYEDNVEISKSVNEDNCRILNDIVTYMSCMFLRQLVTVYTKEENDRDEWANKILSRVTSEIQNIIRVESFETVKERISRKTYGKRKNNFNGYYGELQEIAINTVMNVKGSDMADILNLRFLIPTIWGFGCKNNEIK